MQRRFTVEQYPQKLITTPATIFRSWYQLKTVTASVRPVNAPYTAPPKLAVTAIIPHEQGIVLIRRGIFPAYGEWSFAAGSVNRDEVVERALEREAFEETELLVHAQWLVGPDSEPDHAVLLAVYEAEVRGGQLSAADEVLEAGVFEPGDLPELAFDHDKRIIKDWLKRRPSRESDQPNC